MSERDALIDRIAGLVGVARGYVDAFGRPVESPVEARQAILSGFGLKTGTEAEARESLTRVERLRKALVPTLVPIGIDRPAHDSAAPRKRGRRGGVAPRRRGRRE